MLKQLSLNNCSSPTCYILNQECIFDQAIIIKQETDWGPNYSQRRKFTRSFRSKGGRERERGNPGLTCTGGMERVLGMDQMRHVDGASLEGSCRHRLRTASAWTRSAIQVSPAPAAWRGSSVWNRCGMRMAPAWWGAVGIGCGQRRPGLDLLHPEGELRHLGRGVGGENWLGTSGAASADRLGTGGMVSADWLGTGQRAV